ncbi:MAG: hypothetical protein LC658_04210, partial [Bacteroidales bacterium]|nr:hypothetical protein [Bacteroidales bacterium]
TNTDFIKAMDSYRSTKLIGGGLNALTEKDIEGSPYLNNDFISGKVITTTNAEYVDIPLRFNIYNDQIEFKTEGEEIMILAASEIIEKIEFGEYKIFYAPYSYAKKIKRGFFIVMEGGKADLYAKPEIKFIEATKPLAYQEAQPAKFNRRSDSYYIRIGMDEAKLVENKKTLVDIFPDNKDKIEEFIKKNKTKTNDPESLKELVQFYNSIENHE